MLFLCFFVVNAFSPFISLAETVNEKEVNADIYFDKAKDKEDTTNNDAANKAAKPINKNFFIFCLINNLRRSCK